MERDNAGLRTIRRAFVSASENDGSHGGGGAEERHDMTSSLAPCFLATCRVWIVEGWGSREDELRHWGNDPGSGFRALHLKGPSPHLRGRFP